MWWPPKSFSEWKKIQKARNLKKENQWYLLQKIKANTGLIAHTMKERLQYVRVWHISALNRSTIESVWEWKSWSKDEINHFQLEILLAGSGINIGLIFIKKKQY